MSSLLDRLKVKNIPEKNTEYKILIPRKKSNNIVRKPRNVNLVDSKKIGDEEGDAIFTPKQKEDKGNDKGPAIVDMTNNDMDFSDFFNKARRLVFMGDKNITQQVDDDIEVGKTKNELIIKSINKDKNNKAEFKWEVNTKSQNINPTSISLDLKINKKKVGE